jgi:hypothetical protein
MKRYIYTLLIIGLFSLHASSQNLDLTWSGGSISNGATIDVSVDVNSMIEVHVYVTNNSSSSKEIKVRKEDVTMVSGSWDTYCIGGSCYPGTVLTSPGSVVIPASETDSTFTGDYYPGGNTGTSMIRYTFFCVNDPNDTVSLFIRYTGAIMVPELSMNTPVLSNPYPNPASDRVYFDYEHMGFDIPWYIIIRDMTGRQVREVVVPSGAGTLEIDLSGITPGIHFYSLLKGNSIVQTRKLIIKR